MNKEHLEILEDMNQRGYGMEDANRSKSCCQGVADHLKVEPKSSAVVLKIERSITPKIERRKFRSAKRVKGWIERGSLCTG